MEGNDLLDHYAAHILTALIIRESNNGNSIFGPEIYQEALIKADTMLNVRAKYLAENQVDRSHY